jgi:hypothetical protein
MRNVWTSISAIAGAALIAGAITGFPVFSPDAAKATDAPRLVTKAPLAVTIADTSDRGWPYRASNVRIVTTDRLN